MNDENNDDLKNEESLKYSYAQSLNKNTDFDEKYDEESDYIEKEISFYDFDEQLLQYRPLEIEFLMKSLMNLKQSLILTSDDRGVGQIIDFSHSEKIFGNFKNIKGATICESNIGNLESQLLKFDKAIFHLALSLQDNKLKKFLNRNLSDELDENDSLLNKISNSFNVGRNKENINILLKKQMNNSRDNFSQKTIGILINSRYGQLIHSYYMFFKNLQKLYKSNNNIINGNL